MYYSWDWDNDGGYFKPGEEREMDEPRGLAIRALKIEVAYFLKSMGISPLPMTDNGVFGVNLGGNVKKAQELSFLTQDKVVGPRTTRAIILPRIETWQTKLSIPNNYTLRQIELESGVYLACRNTYRFETLPEGALDDPKGDHGLAQISDPLNAHFPFDNALVCPDGDIKYAYRVGVNVKYMAENQASTFKKIVKLFPNLSVEDQWKVTLFSHNAPEWAKEWAAAGLPDSGGGTVKVGNWTGDKFTWATMYVNAVLARS